MGHGSSSSREEKHTMWDCQCRGRRRRMLTGSPYCTWSMTIGHCIGHFHYRRSFSPSLWKSQVNRLVYGRSPLCVLVTEWSTILNQSWVHYWFIVLQILKFRGRLQNQAGEIEIKSLKSHFLVRLIRIAHQDTSSRYKDIKGSKPSRYQELSNLNVAKAITTMKR